MTVWHSLRGALPWLMVPASWVVACGGTTRNAGETSSAGTTAGGASNRGGATMMQPPGDTGGTRAPGGMATGGVPVMPEGGAPSIMVPGTSDHSKTLTCGANQCKSVKTLAPTVFVDPCCSADDACGVDTEFFAALGASFKDSCQAVGQQGSTDPACPASATQMLPVQGIVVSVAGFAGCCRAETGTCGVVVDSIPIAGFPLPFASPMLGCVDSAPFFGGKPAAACGDGTAGAGSGGAGSGGAGSGGAESNPAGAPGVDSSVAGGV